MSYWRTVLNAVMKAIFEVPTAVNTHPLNVTCIYVDVY